SPPGRRPHPSQGCPLLCRTNPEGGLRCVRRVIVPLRRQLFDRWSRPRGPLPEGVPPRWPEPSRPPEGGVVRWMEAGCGRADVLLSTWAGARVGPEKDRTLPPEGGSCTDRGCTAGAAGVVRLRDVCPGGVFGRGVPLPGGGADGVFRLNGVLPSVAAGR